MKALSYLQKVGAIPDFDKWDVLMAIVVIVTDFYSPDMLIEPDVLDWVQQADSEEDFSDRCDIILYATGGNVRALFPHIHNKPVSLLKGLLECLIDAKIRIFSVINSDELEQDWKSEDEWFAQTYNTMVGLKGKRRFPSKAAILHTYCGGGLTDGGQTILSSLAGTEVDFNKDVVKIQADFARFLSEGKTVRLGEVEYANEKDNPFEGGYQAKVTLIVPGVDDPQECTLHWAPWPTAKTKSYNSEVRAICHSFTEMNKRAWFNSVENI